MRKSLRFAKPNKLSAYSCPSSLAGFVQGLPFIALATDVFGSEAAAVYWMCTPLPALGQRRPADLLLTNPQIVEDLLMQLLKKCQIKPNW